MNLVDFLDFDTFRGIEFGEGGCCLLTRASYSIIESCTLVTNDKSCFFIVSLRMGSFPIEEVYIFIEDCSFLLFTR
jgi:hypothetical protein